VVKLARSKKGAPVLARLSMFLSAGKRRFQDLSEQEVLALAISSEEEDGRIYAAYAAKLRGEYPASAAIFDGMAAEEDEHRRRLIEAYRHRFGEFVVPLRREHVADFFTRRPVWLIENLGLDRIRQEAVDMERQARDFYVAAASRSTDAGTRKLLGDLAAAEAGHQEGRPQRPSTPRTARFARAIAPHATTVRSVQGLNRSVAMIERALCFPGPRSSRVNTFIAGTSGSNLTFESWKGFPSGSLHASLAHANRNFHYSQAC
jgi:rubrerythrin